MELVRHALASAPPPNATDVLIVADRHTLAKRRWRATAADRREFGFDLEHALSNGDAVFVDGGMIYRLAQSPEPVLTVKLGDAAEAARLGWMLGNLHFRIAVVEGAVHAPDDPAIRQLLEREHLPYQVAETVFYPLGGGHAHGPSHHGH